MKDNKLCKCGCGQYVTYNKYSPREYIHGHNGAGIPCPEKNKIKMSIERKAEGNPMFNKGKVFRKIKNKNNLIKLLKKYNYNISNLALEIGCKRDTIYVYIDRFNIKWDKEKTKRENFSRINTGRKFSKDIRLKIKKNHAHYWKGRGGELHPAFGRKIKESSKLKMRISKIKYLESCNGQVFPFYNKKPCNFFNKLNILLNVNIQHAENGGEYYIKDLGYWIDGYEKDLNIVIEWNEDSHYFDGKLTSKHKVRQKNIKRFLKCKFININQKTFNEKRTIERVRKVIDERRTEKES